MTWNEYKNDVKLKDADAKEIIEGADPFYSEINMRHLMKSMEQIRQGRVVVKTMEELETMANE